MVYRGGRALVTTELWETPTEPEPETRICRYRAQWCACRGPRSGVGGTEPSQD